ncbi:diaminopropionate ammonia-lyase [Thalassovita litoralis]|jgi:diaminopropionate ammonia-lyase|uniref:Diaminopropionate ammonia-lyase n=1 Tax=Thalassovita litoralis TaxID=1010611 RepID=A0A521EUU7_9RHOB|nr:diaminopropionate ammonia-lyase [Thalassovita litoralis]SMO87728.1 diaminopropionate ammonia-lyase [Thalassovita litoralis]
MAQCIERKAGTEAAFALCVNEQAAVGAAWTDAQNAILSDAGLSAARATIGGWPGYAETPLVVLPDLAGQLGVAGLYYKDEGGRFGLGSFKALGGAYAVARLLQAKIGAALGRAVGMEEITAIAHPEEAAKITVCCATDGNHGRSVAWGAQSFGCNCVIFIHAGVSEGRKSAIEAYGAEVRRCAGNYDDSVREAQDVATREGWFVVSDTSYPGYMDVPRDVMQGYEVMAAEAFDAVDLPPTHIFLQTGVGGMAAAVAAQAKRRWGASRPRIVLVDPDQSACWLESIRAGKPTAVHGDLDTLMAGLACGEISALAWEILRDHGDAVMTVTDAAAVQAMRDLALPTGGDTPVVAGESAVAGLAGLRAGLSDPQARELLGLDGQSRVMLFGTEGDTDPELYRQLIGRSGANIRGDSAATD